MVWTLKHQNRFSKNGIWAGSRALAAHLYKGCKADESKEVYLKRADFDKDTVKTRGEAYNRTYFVKMIDQLEQKSDGAIVVLEKYNGSYYKLLVRPISFSYENEKSKQESLHQENAGNPMFSEEHKKRLSEQQQQDIFTIDQLLRSIGMVYSKSSLTKIWRMSKKSIDYVKEAIKYMLQVNEDKKEPIRRPHGWLMKCLKFGWHLEDESIFGGLGLPNYESGILQLAKTANTVFYESSGSIPIPIPTEKNSGSRFHP